MAIGLKLEKKSTYMEPFLFNFLLVKSFDNIVVLAILLSRIVWRLQTSGINSSPILVWTMYMVCGGSNFVMHVLVRRIQNKLTAMQLHAHAAHVYTHIKFHAVCKWQYQWPYPLNNNETPSWLCNMLVPCYVD